MLVKHVNKRNAIKTFRMTNTYKQHDKHSIMKQQILMRQNELKTLMIHCKEKNLAVFVQFVNWGNDLHLPETPETRPMKTCRPSVIIPDKSSPSHSDNSPWARLPAAVGACLTHKEID